MNTEVSCIFLSLIVRHLLVYCNLFLHGHRNCIKVIYLLVVLLGLVKDLHCFVIKSALFELISDIHQLLSMQIRAYSGVSQVHCPIIGEFLEKLIAVQVKEGPLKVPLELSHQRAHLCIDEGLQLSV